MPVAFAAEADSLCRTISRKRNLLKATTPAEFDLDMPQLLGYQQALFSGLRAMTAPSGYAGDWSEMIDASHTMLDAVQAVSNYVRANRISAAQSQFASFAKARLLLRSIAKRDGLRACAEY